MEFKSKRDLKELLSLLKIVDSGSAGIVFNLPREKKVLKISNDFFYKDITGITQKEYDLSKFDGIENDSYVLPHELVTILGEPVGIITPYVDGKNICKINTMNLNLDFLEDTTSKLKEDTIKLSKDNLIIFDMPYNTLLTRDAIKVIDTESYYLSNESKEQTLSRNITSLNQSIIGIVIPRAFEDFIESRKDLLSLYKDKEVDTVLFLKEFRKYLSEYKGYYIQTLADARDVLKRTI